jgi:6-phosphogluconolactonase
MIELYLGGEEHIFLTHLVRSPSGFSLTVQAQYFVGALPSFLAFSRQRPLVLALAESGEKLTSLRRGHNGELETISEVPCLGGPAYVALDAREAHALTASYGSGETRVYSVSLDGHLLPQSEWHTGKYTHCAITSPDGSIILSPSKGADHIARSKLNGSSVELLPPLLAPTGSGPRHLIFSNDRKRAYLACENDCSLIVYDANGAELQILQHLPSLPHEKGKADTGADVHLSADDNYIYLSNRGHDSISCFRRTDTGALLVSIEKARCAVPRNFCLLDPDWLIVAGQESRTLSIFQRDLASGALHFLATVDTPERPFWVGNHMSY